MNYVYRHGKRIAVETINAWTPAKRHKPFEVCIREAARLLDQAIRTVQQSGNVQACSSHPEAGFKRHYVGGEIVLSTEATGLSRKVRSKAVKELVGLGLIEIEQNW